MAGGSSSPGNCGLTLAHQEFLQTGPRSDDCLRVASGRRDLDKLRISRQGRSIMADQPNNQGDRMDERSGSSGGSGGGSSGNRTDGGSDTRAQSGVSRKTPRGFAAMDPQAQRAIAAKGGRAAHQKGTAHEFTSEEARVAGRKGGEASRGGRRSSTPNTSNSSSTSGGNNG